MKMFLFVIAGNALSGLVIYNIFQESQTLSLANLLHLNTMQPLSLVLNNLNA
jgi:hypothetical protein